MNDHTKNTDPPALPPVVDRATWQADVDALRVREKAHTREGDAIAAARRKLPIVEVDANLELIGPDGTVTLLDAFEGRRRLIAYYFMWWPGRPAPEQCEGCTLFLSQVAGLSYLHSRDITYAVFSQGRNTAFGPADARRPTRRASAIATSWAGTYRGTQRSPPSTRCSSTASSACSTSCATCATATGFRDLLDEAPRRGGHGLQLRAHGPHRARTPGTLGRLTHRLATTLLHEE